MEKSNNPQHALFDKMRKITFSRVDDVYFRIVFSKRKNEILRTKGSFAYGGRYNPIGEFGGLYLGETREVCRAETEKNTPTHLLAPRAIGKIKVSYEKILNLTDPEILKDLGIKKEELLQDEKAGGYELTQKIARIAYQLGIEGILAPSISGVGKNLIIFDKYVNKEKIELISKPENIE